MNPSHDQAAEQETPEVRAMVLYEDEAAGERANSLLDRISQRSGLGRGLIRNLWMSSLLQTPLLRELAAAEAARSDIIITSVSGKRDLTAVVKDWLMRWLNHQADQPCAFGVLLDPACEATEVTEELITGLQKIASAGGASFFCCTPETMPLESQAGFYRRPIHENNAPNRMARLL